MFANRQLVFNHRQSLAEQLRQETDAAMALHLASVLLVHVHTQCMVHAPGSCVPQIIAFLKQYLPADQHCTLLHSQGYVPMSCFSFHLSLSCPFCGVIILHSFSSEHDLTYTHNKHNSLNRQVLENQNDTLPFFFLVRLSQSRVEIRCTADNFQNSSAV